MPHRCSGDRGRSVGDDLAEMEDTPNTLWINEDSTYHGRHDRVTQAAAAHLPDSLFSSSLKT